MEMATSQLFLFMEIVEAEIEADCVNIMKQPKTELLLFIEMLRAGVKSFRRKLKVVRVEISSYIQS
jgi:hypothetical protein